MILGGMRTIIFRCAVLGIMVLLVSESAVAQVNGVVVEQGNGNPVEFANVVLLSAADSSFVTGAVTDTNGAFSLADAPDHGILKVSFMGYKTSYTNVTGQERTVTISLVKDSLLLDEVVVRAKQYQRVSDGLIVNVSGSTLARLGSVLDVLGHLPFLSHKNGELSVLGKGTPIIYINNRLVRDNSELARINSADIRQVKVITNPGAEYDATVSAVIKITTAKNALDGLSVQADGGVSAERKVSHHAGADVNYHTGGFDVFGSLRYDRNVMVANQTTTTKYAARELYESPRLEQTTLALNASAGLNYQWQDKLSAGVLYRYTGTPNDRFDTTDKLEAYKNNVLVNAISSIDNRRFRADSHYMNVYVNYNWSSDTYLKLDADYLNGSKTNSQDYASSDEYVGNNSKSANKLYAGKLTFGTSFAGGSLKTGIEGAYTDNDNRYEVSDETTMQNELRSTANVAKQGLFALFAQYERSFGEHWSGSVGARFEHLAFNYYVDGVKSDDMSRKYSGIYPSASVAYSSHGIDMSIAYRYTTNRPTYFMLRNSVDFNNPYSYEGGSPELQPSKTNTLSYALSWKDIQLMVDYSMIKNGTRYVLDMYEGSDSITLFHTRNIDRHRILSATLVYSPTWFKVWKPSFTASVTKPYAEYGGRKYDKPLYYFEIDNTVELSRTFILGCDINYNTSGDSDWDFAYQYDDFGTDIYAVKTLLHDKLRIKFSVTNVFDTSRERWDKYTNGIMLEKWNDAGRRTVGLTVTYHFNQKKNKYKGEAATDELKRL